jgi:hypothetical protein
MALPATTALGTAAKGLGISGASSVLSGIGSLASGLFGGRDKGPGFTETRNHNKTLMRDQSYMQNYMSVKHKMNASKEFGIHPLAMMGMSPSALSPVISSGGDNMSRDMGQNISRAAKALQSVTDRKYTNEMNELSLERERLNNELLRSQITKVNQPTVPSVGGGKDYYVDGQGNSKVRNSGNNLITVEPDVVISKSKKLPEFTAGKHSAYKKLYLGKGYQGKDVYMNAPSDGIDSWGEAYAAVKGLEALYKSGQIWQAKKGRQLGRAVRKWWKDK